MPGLHEINRVCFVPAAAARGIPSCMNPVTTRALIIYLFCIFAFLETGHAVNEQDSDEQILILGEKDGEEVGFIPEVAAVRCPIYKLYSPFFMIGGIFALHSPITNFTYLHQIQFLEAFRYAILVANERQTVKGTTITYHAYDSVKNAQYSVPQSIRMVNNDITAVVGPFTTQEVITAGFVLSLNNVTFISPAALGTSVYINNQGTFGRTIPDQRYQSKAFLALLKYMNWSLIVPVTTQNDFGLSFVDSFYNILIDSVTADMYCAKRLPVMNTPADSVAIYPRYLATAKCISNSIANVVLVMMDYEHSQLMVRALNEFPSNRRLILLFPSSAETITAAPAGFTLGYYPVSHLSGSIFARPVLGNVTGFKDYLFNLNPGNTQYGSFIGSWEGSFNCFLNESRLYPILYGYNATLTPEAYSALPLCDSNTSARAWPPNCKCTGKESLAEFDLAGTCRPVLDSVELILAGLERAKQACDPNIPWPPPSFPPESSWGPLPTTRPAFCTPLTKDVEPPVQNRVVLESTNIQTNIPYPKKGDIGVTGYDILSMIIQGGPVMTDSGPIGLIKNSSFSGPLYPNIEFVQLDAKGYFRAIGMFNDSGLVMYPNNFNFPSTIPISAIVPEDVTISSISGIIIFTIATILLIATLLLSVLTWFKRRDPVFRKASPVFCQLILLGLALINVGLMVSCLGPTGLTCTLTAWFVIIGVALIIGSLLAKTWRIFKIFSNIRVRTASIRDADLLKVVGAILSIFVALLIVATIANGTLHATIEYSDVDPLYSYYSCHSDNPNVDTALIIVTSILVGVFILILAGLTYFTRHVDSSYNESVYIAATIYCFTLLIILLIPIILTNPDTEGYAVRAQLETSIPILIASAFTMVALFGSKIYLSQKNKRGSRVRKERAARLDSRIIDPDVVSIESDIRAHTTTLSDGTDPESTDDTHPLTSDRSKEMSMNRPSAHFVTRSLWKKNHGLVHETTRSGSIFTGVSSSKGATSEGATSESSSNPERKYTIGHVRTRPAGARKKRHHHAYSMSLESLDLALLDDVPKDRNPEA